MKEIFEKRILPNHKFYPAEVQFQNNFYKYFLLHVISDFTDEVNFTKSKFVIVSAFNTVIGSVEVDSKEELILKEKNYALLNPDKSISIWAEHLVLNENFNKKPDLFKISQFDSNYYISDSFLTHLKENNITGYSVRAADSLSFI